MKKEFEVKSSNSDNLYTVTFSDESGWVQAHCTCRAGMFGNLCKHVTGIMESDKEVQAAMKETGQDCAWKKLKKDQKKLEKMKREVAAEKKEFAEDFLSE